MLGEEPAPLGPLGQPKEPRRPSRRQRRKQARLEKLQHRTKAQKWRRRIALLLLLLLLIVGGYFAIRVLSATSKLLHGDLASLVSPGTPLLTDDQGRTNILVFGTSQDDSAHQDAAGGGGLWLTDSIMLISLNQKTHVVKLVSIPRDLWAAMPSGCDIGDYAKLNAVYECGGSLAYDGASEQTASDYAEKDQAGAQALESSIATITGITPQYYVHVNYSVLKQAVDAVGGIQVDIQGDGADGIYDTNFDWDCPNGPYTCKNVYYPHDGTYTIDGTQALFLARARGDYGTYSYKDFGLDQGDFDRQANQQKILMALKSKILSAGTLLNPIAFTNLLSSLGNNVTTDLQAGNYKTLMTFVKAMPKTNGMQSVSLVQSGKAVVQGSMIDGQSVEIPTSGELDYSSISNLIAQALSTNPVTAEGASIAVYNASDVSGAAAALQAKLAQAGLNVDTIGSADAADAGSSHYTIYDTTGGKKPSTIKYLTSTYGMSTTSSSLPSDIPSGDDIVIIIGADNSTNSSNN